MALAAVAAIGIWRGHAEAVLALVPGAILALTAAVAPDRLAPLSRAWLGLGNVLHRIVSPIAIGVIFFGVITPYALVMRVAGRDALRMRDVGKASSFWLPRTRSTPSPESFRQQF